jgi:integrase
MQIHFQRYIRQALYGFHSLRHFVAGHLADKEKPGLKVISGLLRHKTLTTTEIYLHPIDESQRSAMDQIEGKFTPKNVNPRPLLPPQKEREVAVDP